MLAILILLFGHTAVHYSILIPEVGEVVEHLPFFNLHVLHEAEFLVVIAYASWVFRLRGGVLALTATTLASLPFIFASRINPLEYLEYGFAGPDNSTIEVAVLLAIGTFIVFVNEMWARERDRRIVAAGQLETANTQLVGALGELQSTQRRLVQQERLSALGQMASGVVHDFNNALSPILGYSELLLALPKHQNDDGETRASLLLIKTAAETAAGVVRRLRDFYRPKGHAEVFQPMDLNEVVKDSLALTRPRWQPSGQEAAKSLEVKTQLMTPLPRLLGDESAWRDVLINLIFNAVDAMPEGGKLTLGTRRGDRSVLLQVEDTGLGMTDEVRTRCLEPWFTTKGEKGTGLGLATVYGVVQRHSGTIDIESEVGKGTRFVITLPVKDDVEGERMGPEAVRELDHAGADLLKPGR